MTDRTEMCAQGQQKLNEVALRYAGQHGLRPDRVEWTDLGYQWMLRVSDADHAVKVAFSTDEIVDFAEQGPGSQSSKTKLRNAFASLAM